MAHKRNYNEEVLKSTPDFTIDEGLKKLVQPMLQEMLRIEFENYIRA